MSNTGNKTRLNVRKGIVTGQTSGLAPGFVQCNIVILPQIFAMPFLAFCQKNPRSCPLLAISPEPGNHRLPELAEDLDIRTDVPSYIVWEDGIKIRKTTNIRDIWQNDWTAFALGCSFSFEEALIDAGVEIRNVSEGVNVPMYKTDISCASAEPFTGNMVVSMRPMPARQAIRAIQVCSRFPSVHGAPIHLGDPRQIGICNLAEPDFGDPVTLRDNDIPLFWACGVTPQLALQNARVPIAITHEPGHMLITDMKNTDLALL